MACPAAAVYVKNKNWGFWSRWGTKTATSWDPQKDWQVKWRVLIWVFVARVEQSYFFENTSVTIFPLFFCHSNMYRDRHRKPCWPLQASSQRRCPPRAHQEAMAVSWQMCGSVACKTCVRTYASTHTIWSNLKIFLRFSHRLFSHQKKFTAFFLSLRSCVMKKTKQTNTKKQIFYT